MKKILILLSAFAAFAVGCQEEIDNPQDKLGTDSSYLVINASCKDTKTDINEGKTTWEQGDVIEVVYKGKVYEYSADESGRSVTFSSEEGITGYDGSSLTAYYKALNAADGIVGIEAEKSIEWQTEGQANPACAPLVGTPVSDKAENGVLDMEFHNIFSIMELRVDPAGKPSASPMKSLTVEPADGSVFNGYLSFTGSVDTFSLALAASENGTGNTLVLNFPTDTDITKAQTIKFPIGRFSSSTGLKLTLALESGEKFERVIYQDGLTTYEEKGGIYSVKHLVRAIYSFVPTFFSGGDGSESNPYAIGSVEDLNTLSEYVASKDSEFLPFRTACYQQIADIDFKGATLNSIGNTNDADPYSFFCGKYDGNGYKVTNVVIANVNSNKSQGFFGYLDGDAYVKNITLDNVTMDCTTWNVGTIVGCVQSTSTAVIENCHVTNADITTSSNSLGGIVGKLMNGTIKNCSYQGTVTGKDQNVGGICGQTNNNGVISGCTFKGTVKQVASAKHQCGGIVGFVNSTTTGLVENCIFDGTVTASCGNVGGIAGALCGGSTVKGCSVSKASIVEAGSKADNGINLGGIVGYVNNSTAGGQVLNNSCAGTVISHYYDAGGIVGHNRGLAIRGCTFSGTVSTDYDDSGVSYGSSAGGTAYGRVGGICGDIRGAGNIDRCTMTGTVSGKKWTGGIVGLLEAGGVNSCTVSSATVTGDNGVAGVVGYVSTGAVKGCSVTSSAVNGTQNVGGIVGSLVAAGSVTSCQVTGSSVKASSLNVGGVAGHFNKGGMISQCTTKEVAVETAHKLAGGILGNMAECTDAKTSRIENCHVSGGTVVSTANGIVGGIVGGCNGYGIVNKCSASCNVRNTGTAGGCVGGIAGWVSTNNMLIANCIYYGGELSNDNDTHGGVAGIAGSFAASALENTAVVNSAAFPVKVSTGSGNANIAGIAGYANTVTINNCYCPTPASAFFFNGTADGSSRGSIYGWLRGNSGATGSSGIIVNAYWIDGFKAGASSGSYTYTKAEQSLTDAQMKNTGAVSMPLTSVAYSCFIDALNAGADEYNKAMIFDVRAEEWVMGSNGYPVIYGCPIASSTAVSSKTRVSFLGDSITTYKGYTLFPNNGQYPNNNYSDFTSVSQTYWYQLIYDKMTNAVLEANSSHTATCVQNTTKNGYPGYGFINRYADLGNPDVIFINGGTNDSWSFNLPVGSLDFSIATDNLDTYQFAQAYDKLIRLTKGKYPKAKIVCIIGDCVMDSKYSAYAQVIRDVCNHYSIKYAEVVFADRAASTYDSVHPNVAGMKEMADQIWDQVKSYM